MAVLLVLVVFAALLRVVAAQNPLWFDELFSLGIARQVNSAWEIFTGVHLDNNHYLNTLYLRALPAQAGPTLDRAFSLLCGAAVVPAGYWLLSRRSRSQALFFAGLLAASYPLIHFASEARGYSGAVLGTVVAAAALRQWLAKPSLGPGLAYSFGVAFALLSHLTACLVWAPLALGSGLALLLSRDRRRFLAGWAALNLLPALLLLGLYQADLHRIKALSSSPMAPGDALTTLLAYAVGWPWRHGPGVLLLVLPLAIWGGVRLWRPRDPFALPFLFVLAAPAAALLFLHPSFFSPRYFLVVLPFIYLPAALFLDRLTRTARGRTVAFGLLLLFVIGQAVPYVRLVRLGRGRQLDALRYIAAHSAGPIRITSNLDLRFIVELSYLRTLLPPDLPFAYVEQKYQGILPADWYILHLEGGDPPGAPSFTLPGDPPWYRVAHYEAPELSGQAWTLYSHDPRLATSSGRRDNAPPL